MTTARWATVRRFLVQAAGATGLTLSFGCATENYQYSQFNRNSLAPKPIVFEQGKPDKTLDTVAYVVETPQRVLPFVPQYKRHELSPQTTEKLATYLRDNDLADVKIQVNEYDPSGQWKLLRENNTMAAGWRYTAGAWSILTYTLFPGRVFGTNHYNLYTNTLNINSDRPAALLREAAVAKDMHKQHWPGTYAAYTSVPGLAMIRRVRSVNEVASYARITNDWEIEKQVYHDLYPAVGMETMSMGAPIVNVLAAWWCGPLLPLGGAAVGGITGYAVSSFREAEVIKATPPAPQPRSELQQVSHIGEAEAKK